MPRIALVLATAVLAATACARGGTESGAQGVRGVVLRGPMCPVEQEGTPCPDEPVPGARISVLRDGEVVATATSDPRGRFEIALEPGRYTLQAEPGSAGMFAKPVEVTVQPGAFARVDLLIDTGIR
jgi:hypothetical protein